MLRALCAREHHVQASICRGTALVPAFKYEAADATGRALTGVLEADSERHARQILRDRSLTPLATEAIQQGAGAKSITFRRRLSSADLMLATRQLANLIGARLPLEQALSALIEQTEKPAGREVWAAVRSKVTGGSSFAGALAEFPKEFPDVYRALIAAGEESGDLPNVLMRLAEWLENRGALKSKVFAALTYPAIVSVVAVVIVVALMTYVVPQVVGVFTSTKQQLPFLTVALIAISDFIRGWWWALLLVIIAVVFFVQRSLKMPAIRMQWHTRMLSIPIVGALVRAIETERFASTLSILTAGGVPLLRGLEAARQTVANNALSAKVEAAIVRVREGTSLARALQSTEGAKFPPVLTHLIASGEQTGRLPDMLQRAADIQTKELERRTMALTSLLEPVLILVMGGIVLMIVLAVLMPIIEINQLVR
jgi:general secretion pathway protein F